ncbi:MAG: glycosyltransferase family 2 protein [Cyanobacteriota bacterium]
MKDRVLLALLIIILWIFLILIKVYLPEIPSTLFVLAFMILYCLILAMAQMWIKIRSRKTPLNVDKPEYSPLVNIFIPAHNEELVLSATIENLIKIDYPKYNILIINDRSKDNTAQIAKELSEKYPEKVKYHTRPDDAFPGKSAVLNDAFNMTDGEVICVFDADAKVEPDFLSKMIPYLADEEVKAVQARKVMLNKNTNILTQCQHYEYCMDVNVQLGRDSLRAAVELRGNGQLIKRSAVEAVDKWNLNTVTDDLDMSTRLHVKNYIIRLCTDTCVKEEAVESFKAIIRQRKRWAEGSIRRYLDYSDQIIFSKEVSRKLSLDMLAYFSEFVLPVWLISDFILQVVYILAGGTPQILSNLLVLAAIGAFFITLLFSSILKFERCGILFAFIASIKTAIFVIILWTIVVISVVFKIIFTKRSMKWYKPDRVAGNS